MLSIKWSIVGVCLSLSLSANASVLSELKAAATKKLEAHVTRLSQPQGGDVQLTRLDARSVNLDYGFYQMNYSCEHRGFNYLHYRTVPDQGSLPRYEPFHDEPVLEGSGCPAQKRTSSYKKVAGFPLYHRGHGTHQNIWDHDNGMMALTNRMTNVVPHHGEQNIAGLWRALEKRVECARDETTVTVYLGNDWGNDTTNDHFVKSHGVTTPDFLWRVHVYDSHPNQAFVWYFRNDGTTRPVHEASRRITLSELNQHTADDFKYPFPSSWVDARGSDPYTKLTCSLK